MYRHASSSNLEDNPYNQNREAAMTGDFAFTQSSNVGGKKKRTTGTLTQADWFMNEFGSDMKLMYKEKKQNMV